MSQAQKQIEEIVETCIEVLLRPVATINEAALLSGYWPNTIRNAIATGSLVAIRQARSGPARIQMHELARWILDGEANSLPYVKRSMRRQKRSR